MEKNNTIVDLLNRQPLIDRLKYITDLLSKGKKNACYAINGEWGSGKSFVLDMFEKEIAEIKTDDGSDYRYMLFHYNCWQYDYYDEPLIAIVAAMQDYVAEENDYGITDETKTKLAGTVKSIAENLVGSFSDQIKAKLGFDLVSLIKNGIEGFKEGTTKWDEDHSYDPHFQFKETIRRLRDSIAEFANDRTIVFVVDELDRCLPKYAIKVLERLHHVFDEISNVQVILAVDKGQLGHTIKKIFGSATSEKQYLAKFVDFEVHLNCGNIQDSFRTIYSPYFDSFFSMPVSDDEIDHFLSSIFQGIDMRTCKAIMEKSILCHNLLANATHKCNVFLCIEIFLSLLKHFRLNEHKAKDCFSIKQMFIDGSIFEHAKKPSGLAKYGEVFLKQPAPREEYLETREDYTNVFIGNLNGIILACYRLILGFNDYWCENLHAFIVTKDIPAITEYVNDYWNLLSTID